MHRATVVDAGWGEGKCKSQGCVYHVHLDYHALDLELQAKEPLHMTLPYRLIMNSHSHSYLGGRCVEAVRNISSSNIPTQPNPPVRHKKRGSRLVFLFGISAILTAETGFRSLSSSSDHRSNFPFSTSS
jgi:hypothetical protein